MDEFNHSAADHANNTNLSLVRLCLQNGNPKKALYYCQLLLAKNPNNINVLLFAAIAARAMGDMNDAYQYADYATKIAPENPAPHSLLGDILLIQKKSQAALEKLLHSESLGDRSPQNLFNIGSAYLDLERFKEAKAKLDDALAINPAMAAANVNKGLAEHSLMNLESAIDCFDLALRIEPNNIDAKWNKSHVLLTKGDYQAGFRLFETRWQNPKVRLRKRTFESQLWLGQSDISGKTVLLHAEGGFGDTFQFIRYVRLFDEDVSLIIQCQKPLIDLVRNSFSNAQIIAPGDEIPDHDFHCPLMSLPLAFGHDLETVPAFHHYIYARNDLSQKWKPLIDKLGKPKIGLMVRGSGSFNGDKRSIQLEKLERYLPSDAVFLYLQKELFDTEKNFIDSRANWMAPCADFSGTAAICESLDIVISVDTSVVHLAAAMGKPTLLLLPFRPDWRWGEKGEKTIWYPSCTLLRQPQHDDWESVFKSISPAIAMIIA